MSKFDYNERHIANAHYPGLSHLNCAIDQYKVQQFMVAMGQQIGTRKPEPADLGLCKKLVAEEAKEFADAVDANDFPGMVDALADLLYVTYVAFVAFGVNSKYVFNLVHEANMAKLGGLKDEHGKQLKPDGWVEPDVAGLLRTMGWQDTKTTGGLK